MSIQQTIAIGLGGLVLVTVGRLVIRFHLGRRRADRASRLSGRRSTGGVKTCGLESR